MLCLHDFDNLLVRSFVGPPSENLEKLITGNAFSKHFRRFLVTLKEWVIPRKQQGELDSDPKMNL